MGDYDADVYDLVGIGFGPANLSLAVAVAEYNTGPGAQTPVTARFLERQESFGWHRGMLIPDARMQVCFLKDLATPRNPTSPFGFLSYLADRGRFADFLNRQTFFPTRLEFHDYLVWAADRVPVAVDYATTVTEVTDAGDQGGEPVLEVRAHHDSRPLTLRARNVVIATGLEPRLPDGVEPSERVWHSSELMPRVAKLLTGPAPRRFVVVGAGQSAAECVEYLHRTFDDAEVCAVFSRWGYSPADDSCFANRVFDPGAVDEYYQAPPEVRDQVRRVHHNTNYSAVDPDLIQALYERHYAERVAGRERLRFLKVSTVEEYTETEEAVQVRVRSGIDGTVATLDADALVYATGYRARDPARLLPGLTVARDEAGRPQVGRDYRLVVEGTAAGIYLQGATEHSHGLSSTLLSNAAIRAGEILDSVLARRAAPAPVPLGGR